MRIIALQGRHNSGKTATLKKLIEIVYTAKDKFQFESVSPKGDVLELCRKRKGDMQYWCSYNGIKIGITTRGDHWTLLNADVFTKRRNFSDRDIVICAIRTSGSTVDFVNKHSTPAPIIYQKELAPDTDDTKIAEINVAQAKQILDDLIQLAIKKGAEK